ncbi:MAG: glycosyltransferase family 2 protein, partial [Bacteroidia bacterium]|nr:glycosyltransferase family 2 protein [Bacteroidia bacterium]
MSEQLISILMPAYNCEKFVKQAIESVLDQSYSNFELLIADDCSTDQTKKVIDSYSDQRIKKFHNQVNLGYLK